MHPQPTLKTDRLLLRPLQVSDALTVKTLAGDSRIAEMTENIPHPYENSMAEDWIKTLQPRWEKRTHACFAVCRHGYPELIGCCGLSVVAKHRRASLGYWIGTEHWGNGYCTEAAREVVSFGFAKLGLNRIEAQHLVKNPASGAVLRKIGMNHEATMREYVFNDGTYEDMELYSKLAQSETVRKTVQGT